MTISNAKAQWQIFCSAASTANQGNGSIILGDSTPQSQSFTDANIAYGMRITAAAAGNVATLTTTSGTVAQTTGSPTVTRWGSQTGDLTGEDAEGVTLTTLVTLYVVKIFTPTVQTGSTGLACSAIELPDIFLPQNTLSFNVFKGGLTSPGTIAFTFANISEYIDVFVLGKST